MYIPEYLEGIQPQIKEMVQDTQTALETLVNSAEYNDGLHPFHAAAVSTYNKLVTIILTLEGFSAAQ